MDDFLALFDDFRSIQYVKPSKPSISSSFDLRYLSLKHLSNSSVEYLGTGISPCRSLAKSEVGYNVCEKNHIYSEVIVIYNV